LDDHGFHRRALPGAPVSPAPPDQARGWVHCSATPAVTGDAQAKEKHVICNERGPLTMNDGLLKPQGRQMHLDCSVHLQAMPVGGAWRETFVQPRAFCPVMASLPALHPKRYTISR